VQPSDARVLQALTFLESCRGPRPIERAAAASGVSVSRLRALAWTRLEVPLARWLTLRQLQRAFGVTPATVATIVWASDRRFVQDPAQSG
jgi:hypothetical protein